MITVLKQFNITIFHRNYEKIIGRCEEMNLEISTAR